MSQSPSARSEFNDLRGQTVREVHRDDAVVISGAEYLRLRRIKDTVETLAAVYAGDGDIDGLIVKLEELTDVD